MSVSKRDVLKGLFVGGFITQLPTASWAKSDNAQSPPTFTLSNGLRVHFSPKESGYVSAALVLRSKHIEDPRGLAHIMEHTSFTGAAGSMTAKQVKDLHSDCVQESNATTGGGMIQWNASVLSKNTAQVLELLANHEPRSEVRRRDRGQRSTGRAAGTLSRQVRRRRADQAAVRLGSLWTITPLCA